MNARVLEILKKPELFSENDLKLFEDEIKTYPYIQSIRAVYLYGVHLFRPNQYQAELVKTAAYTTEKKILYQLINKEKPAETETQSSTSVQNQYKEKIEENNLPTTSTFPIPKPEPVAVERSEELKIQEVPETVSQEPQAKTEFPGSECTHGEGETCVIQSFYGKKYEDLKHTVFVNGVRNRILFEGEEELLYENEEEKLRSKKVESTEERVEFADISFHGVEDFMPETPVFVSPKINDTTYQPPKNDAYSKHLEEMQRLIAEVEAKMNANKKPRVEAEEIPHQHEINFAPSYDEGPTFVSPVLENKEITRIEEAIPQETILEQPQQEINAETSGWRPMNLEQYFPSSGSAEKQNKPELELEKTENQKENISEAEIPELHVSFLSDESQITVENPVQETSERADLTDETSSNVQKFINTWQDWLRIDRSQEEKIKPVSIEEIKTKAIEKFLETEPKITRAKEEINYTVKEKNNDISHLMTETLANLYVTQKLYSKAIQAFELLSEKYPEKTEIFKEKIKEIKEKKNQG